MPFIDINREKEKSLYRIFKEIEDNGRSIVDRDTRIGQKISKRFPELIVTGNRRKNITIITLPLSKTVEENPFDDSAISRFFIRRR